MAPAMTDQDRLQFLEANIRHGNDMKAVCTEMGLKYNTAMARFDAIHKLCAKRRAEDTRGGNGTGGGASNAKATKKVVAAAPKAITTVAGTSAPSKVAGGDADTKKRQKMQADAGDDDEEEELKQVKKKIKVEKTEVCEEDIQEDDFDLKCEREGSPEM